LTALIVISSAAAKAKQPEYKITGKDLGKLSPAMQDELAGLQYLMNPYQIKQFLSLPDDSARVNWLESFWKWHDPTPDLSKNPMKREHYIRVRLARQFFKSNEWPGWDRRGEVFIRYGPPDYRGKIWGEVTHKKMYPPSEIWFYKKLDMLVSFQNFGLHGEYIYSLNPLGAAQDLSPEMVDFLIYDTSQSLSSKIPTDLLENYAAGELTEGSNPNVAPNLPESIDAIMDPDRKEMEVQDISSIFQMDKIKKAANNFEVALKNTPVSYPFNFTNKPLHFYFDISQFKAGSELNRVEVHFEVPVGGKGQAGSREYDATAEIWDARFNEVARANRPTSLELSPGLQEKVRLFPTQLVFSLKKGYYRMAVGVREEGTNVFSSYKTTLSVEDFTGALAISDIIFASKIGSAVEPSLFTHGPLEIIPHPLHAYKRAFSIPIYFEIYNLRLDEGGTSSYTVEYKIIPHSAHKEHFWDRYEKTIPVVSSRFSGSGMSRDETQHLLIRTENFDQGSYDLMVTVKDEHAQAVSYRKASFSIVK
jgi:GWxTD domain-containing protein